MKRIAISAVVLLLVGGFVVIATGASSGSAQGTYKIELDNAFGLVSGENFKVAGVVAGTIQSISLDPKNLHAVVTVSVNTGGFGQFHSDAFCESRPQSLIGEYFINCDPGTSGKVLKPGSTIPVTQTESTVPADLIDNIMRLPERERFTVLINELGAGLAGQSGDLQAALDRAVPALTETDNLLRLLGNDSQTLEDLTSSSDKVITALANNSKQVQRFVVEAGNTAHDTATQDSNLQRTFADLPSFLEQLKPALQKLDTATTTNEPVLANLNAASGELDTLFKDLPPFANSARPALKSLGTASVTGRSAVIAARPTVKDLNQFTVHTPELAKNLAIVLRSLDTQADAVERDPRSPGGKGFSGLQALLGYAFNQTLAINTYSQYGHMLTVDAFVSAMCTPYATPSTIATNLKSFGSAYRSCYSWLGPNQPGVTEPDSSCTKANGCTSPCVPDPGGAPPGEAGPTTTACKLSASDVGSSSSKSHRKVKVTKLRSNGKVAATRTSGATGSSGSTPATSSGTPSGQPINIGKTVGAVLGLLGGGSGSSSGSSGSTGSTGSSGTSGDSGGGGGGNQTQQLLNYLLSP
jgi:virulence factor Mce-like protein